MNKHMVESVILLARGVPNMSVEDILWFARSASTLHKRFEAECSYQWADTDKYRDRTQKLVERVRTKAREYQMGIEINQDPRGAPLKIVSFKGETLMFAVYL